MMAIIKEEYMKNNPEFMDAAMEQSVKLILISSIPYPPT